MNAASNQSDSGHDGHVEALRPGTEVGAWEIVRELGHGGFSIVYEARNKSLGSKAALKEFKPMTALRSRADNLTLIPASPEYRQPIAQGLAKFEEEGRNAANLWQKHRSPGVVGVHDLIQANGTSYLAMDLIDGRTLFEELESRKQQGAWPKLEQSWILKFLCELLDIAESLHRAGMIHRDLKPQNVMFSEKDGNPRLTVIDFGAARNEYIKFDMSKSSVDAALTHGYAAPEQYAGGEQTFGTQGAWTDIYAIGGIVHWLMLGKHPPSAALGREPLWPKLRKRYDERLLKSVDKAMAKPAAERWQDVADWRKKISPLLGSGTKVPPRWPAVLATLVLVGLGGAAGYWWFVPPEPEPELEPRIGTDLTVPNVLEQEGPPRTHALLWPARQIQSRDSCLRRASEALTSQEFTDLAIDKLYVTGLKNTCKVIMNCGNGSYINSAGVKREVVAPALFVTCPAMGVDSPEAIIGSIGDAEGWSELP